MVGNMIKEVWIVCGTFLIFTWMSTFIGNCQDVGLTIEQFCQKYGYTLYNETVTTNDNYILTINRIPCPKDTTNCQGSRPPVLIVHGLEGSSVDFLIAKNQSVAFQLADKGYDVWLGNVRGNLYSRRHVTLDPDNDSEFWNYSFHEIGMYDIPAMIDRITASTNFSKITYIGMSQASTAYFVMASSRPEYNDKILLANAIAPVVTLYQTKTPLFNLLEGLEFMFKLSLPFEVFGNNSLQTTTFRAVCLSRFTIIKSFCTEYVVKYLIGASNQINYDLLSFVLSVFPAGGSSKQFLHYIQNKKSGNFCQFDYGDENEARYGQAIPPEYDLSKITSPVAVYFSIGDSFLNITHLMKYLQAIPNTVLLYQISDDDFEHLDFVLAKDLNVLCNNKLMETIDLYNK